MSLSFRKATYVKNRLYAWLTGRTNAHLIHIRKTGGTALKHVLTQYPVTPHWMFHLHPHRITLADIPAGHRVLFVTRDPVSRYVSGFGSRLRQGAPAHNVPWTAAEKLAFARFTDANSLALALDPAHAQHAEALHAMKSITHLNCSYWDWFGDVATLDARADAVFFVGRIETCDADFQTLKQALQLPDAAALPTDPKAANRQEQRPVLSPEAIAWLKRWYERDYDFLTWCAQWRERHGGPVRAASASGR